MNNPLKGRDILSTTDLTKNELDLVIELAMKLKRMGVASHCLDTLRGKTLFLLFFHPSTRTRMSFIAAMHQLGGFVQCPEPSDLRLSLEDKPGAGETIKDTARVAERYVDAIGIRLYARPAAAGEQKALEPGGGEAVMRKFAEYTTVPIINMCSDLHHPTQALADVMVMQERLGDVRRKRIVMMWAYSPLLRRPQAQQRTALISAIYGMDVTFVCPEEYNLDPSILARAREECARSGSRIEETNNLEKALEGADAVFPRVWATPNFYTNPKEEELRLAAKYKDWKLTDDLLKLTNNACFINSMPFDRGNEVADSVADGPNSAIYDEAENLLHVRKAILALTMADHSQLESIWNVSEVF